MVKLKRWSVNSYKAKYDDDIEFLVNPNNGKVFFTCGYRSDGERNYGAVGEKATTLVREAIEGKITVEELRDKLEIHRVRDEQDGSIFDVVVAKNNNSFRI